MPSPQPPVQTQRLAGKGLVLLAALIAVVMVRTLVEIPSVSRFLPTILLNGKAPQRNGEYSNKKTDDAFRDPSFWTAPVDQDGYVIRHAIFYNVYVDNKTLDMFATNLLKDQLGGNVRPSRVANRSILYYNMIGGRNNRTLLPLCPVRECRFLRHFPQAWEDVTLTELHRYCVANPDHTVLYLHNKGSLHNARGNEKMRRMATRAVVSDQCAFFSPNKSTCTTCGLTFQAHPHFHYSTNMWSAQCQYVRQLHPPQQYARLREELFACPQDADKDLGRQRNQSDAIPCSNVANQSTTATTTTTSSSLSSSLPTRAVVNEDAQKKFIHANGLGRYAMERWIVSHPALKPCHIYTGSFDRFVTGREDWPQDQPLLQPAVVRIPTQDNKKRNSVVARRAVLRSIHLHTQQMERIYRKSMENYELTMQNGICTVLWGLPQDNDSNNTRIICNAGQERRGDMLTN